MNSDNAGLLVKSCKHDCPKSKKVQPNNRAKRLKQTVTKRCYENMSKAYIIGKQDTKITLAG